MMQTQPFEKHVWAEIDLEALRHNFRAVKARAGALPLCAVVKADSYGHGAVQCARVFAEEGAAWLAVSCLTEAVQLRKGGLTLPILVLGHVQPGYAAALIQNHITVACYSAAQAKALSDAAVAAGGRVQIHLKADTGMGRIGFALRTDFDAAIRDMLTACALPGLEMTGLFQHFSVADDVSEDNIAYTAEQHRLFVQAFHALKAAGQEPQLVHCDNSAGVMLHPDWPEGLPRERCMARPGIILYGYDPSDEVRFGCFTPGDDPQDRGEHDQGDAARPVCQLRPPFHRRKTHQGGHPVHRLRRRLPPPTELRQGRRGNSRRSLPGAGPGVHGPDDGGRDRCAGGTRGRRSHPVGRHRERHRRDHRPQNRHHFL